MLSKKNIDDWKKVLPDFDKLLAAIADEKEVEHAAPIGSIYTDEQMAEMKENVKTGYSTAYPEIWGKELNVKHELGLSVTDAKNPEKVLAALQAKAVKAAGVEPNKKVQELEASIKKLQDEVIPEYEGKTKEWERKYKEREEFDAYAEAIPEGANKFLTKSEHVARVRSSIAIGENGIAIDVRTKQPFKDKLEKPVLFKDKVQELYKSNDGWLQPETPAAPRLNHTTHGSPHRKAGAFDHAKTMEDINARFDTTTPEGRAEARKAMDSAMAEQAKVA